MEKWVVSSNNTRKHLDLSASILGDTHFYGPRAIVGWDKDAIYLLDGDAMDNSLLSGLSALIGGDIAAAVEGLLFQPVPFKKFSVFRTSSPL
jgi:hypothetical protein